MSEPKIVKTAQEAADLPFGTPYILDVGFNEPDHNPIQFSAAYLKARNEPVKPAEPDDEEDEKTNNGRGNALGRTITR